MIPTTMTHKRKNPYAAPLSKDPNRYPKGLDRKNIRAVIDHYENQTEDQAVVEDEAAYENNLITMMAAFVELVSKVQGMIAKRAG